MTKKKEKSGAKCPNEDTQCVPLARSEHLQKIDPVSLGIEYSKDMSDFPQLPNPKMYLALECMADYVIRGQDIEVSVICDALKMDRRTIHTWIRRSDFEKAFRLLIYKHGHYSFDKAVGRLSQELLTDKISATNLDLLGKILKRIDSGGPQINVGISLQSYVSEDGSIQTKVIDSD